MNKIKQLAVFFLAVGMLLTGCGRVGTPGGFPNQPSEGMMVPDETGKDPIEGNTEAPVTNAVIDSSDMFTKRDFETAYDAAKCGTITLKGSSIESSTNAVKISGTTVQIVEEGTYVFSGTLNDGQIVINGKNTDKIQLVLNGVEINSSTSAAIYVLQADKVFITTGKDTENTLKNGGSFVAIDENNIDAVIFSKDDLTLNGEGSLTIESPAGHGVVSKDDLAVTGGQYTITSASHGLNGKESVRIAGGTFNLTAGKDGIHAEDNDDTSLGFGYISSGNFTISAEGDGIAASNKLEISGGDFNITAGGGSENGTKQNSGNYGGFMGGGRPGKPGGSGGFYPGGNSGGFPTMGDTTDTDSTSMKGVKAGGDLQISGGNFAIDSADDALHSNMNGVISGGVFQLATGDDGVHAEERLTVTDGVIKITESYEGLEALHIAVSGGEISLVASDDGLNAAGGVDNSGMGGRDQMFGGGKGGFGGMQSGNGSIVISGGTLHVQASGDGIDANGTLEITGGFVTVCGPTQGDTATLDYDKTAVISGGTFIGTGASGMAQTFSSSENQGVIAVQAGSVPAGTKIVLKNTSGQELITYSPALNYNVIILSCPEIAKGETYTLCVGEQSASVKAN